MKKDYYATLGLKPGASEKEIRSAYKRLAKKYHPDFNPGNKQAEEKFKEISEAHAVLTDPDKRSKWERGDFDFESFIREARRAPGRGGSEPFASSSTGAGGIGSIFSDLFGELSGRRGAGRWEGAQPSSPGADLQCHATIGFEEAVKGTALTLPLARTTSCASCHGEGFIRSSRTGRCKRCGGSGSVTMGGGPFRMTSSCPECGGTGTAPGDPCSACGGTGTQRSNEKIQVRIPPGAVDGSKVRVADKGEAGYRGGPPGDLYVILHVKAHPHFRREGKDIVLDVPLTVTEAALGTRIDVPTIDGRVTLTVPQGSSSGQKLRLRGRGVPSPNSSGRGDQIVVLQIVTPRSLDERSRRVLEELGRLNPANPRKGLGW